MTKELEKVILCLFLEEAGQRLEKAGISFEVKYTGPPSLPCEGRERVVRFRFRGDTGVVTAAWELRNGK
ncbi:MAG: hypothetical protein ACOY4I_01645 [Bacillota bacterium]